MENLKYLQLYPRNTMNKGFMYSEYKKKYCSNAKLCGNSPTAIRFHISSKLRTLSISFYKNTVIRTFAMYFYVYLNFVFPMWLINR